ncbi:MAG TPA: XRE family transcriptional regulator [Herpetosiphon sp.]|uniref:Transcriptional regulator, XRE family n=1 Tax=Herpetosiphon aurantiacus (strain ATCC 23779 / DSM 785 / 114-95) TaxID=316274 RepID=A9B2J6_HERA2|nr:helix-turn-helix transcriptional regulator [Herpetosiphon sp.]ABX04041.1 transcriptional regulator, XRE family [Herpetosiphon aurantiacus DSM 785]HBW49240.1 XRE family transcriptional regulator [Herpetosiphon sp.]
MTTGLIYLIKSEMDARGWNQTKLSEISGIPDSTISKILKNPNQIPKLENLATLAQAFDIPLARIIAACGFDVSSAKSEDSQRLQTIVSAIPDFQRLVEEMMTFSPLDQADVLAYIEMRRLHRQKNINQEVDQS